MTKFVFLAHGDIEWTPDVQQAHMAWWESLADHVVDAGHPLGNGRTVTRDGDVSPITDGVALGYSIIEAESLDAAIALLATCPMDIWVYEALPM